MSPTHYRTDRAGRKVGLDWQMHGGLENPEDEPTDSRGNPLTIRRRDYNGPDDMLMAGARGGEVIAERSKA